MVVFLSHLRQHSRLYTAEVMSELDLSRNPLARPIVLAGGHEPDDEANQDDCEYHERCIVPACSFRVWGEGDTNKS